MLAPFHPVSIPHVTIPVHLCAPRQDASRDAEGSSVADIVRKADPEGDRTVFVLTKVDLAEKLHLPAAKLQAILKGEKFNMQARAYFAVITGRGSEVGKWPPCPATWALSLLPPTARLRHLTHLPPPTLTGTSNPEESIDRIRSAERQYFHTSPLVKSGVLPPRRTGTDNLARAVADVFWERVRDTVAGEARDIARALKQKENEWKNTYPNHARMSRDDLYNMGRHEILQNITEFNDAMTAEQWESVLNRRIWDCIRSQVIDDVYVASADAASPAEFKTRVENMLDNWVATELPRLSVQAARDTLMGEFLRVLTIRDPDGVRRRRWRRWCGGGAGVAAALVWRRRWCCACSRFLMVLTRPPLLLCRLSSLAGLRCSEAGGQNRVRRAVSVGFAVDCQNPEVWVGRDGSFRCACVLFSLSCVCCLQPHPTLFRSVQELMLRDDMIRTRRDWDTAVAYVVVSFRISPLPLVVRGQNFSSRLPSCRPFPKTSFMQSRLESEFMTSDRQLQEMQGPRGWWSWVAWQR